MLGMASHGIPRTSQPAVKTEESRRKELQAVGTYKALVKLLGEKIAAHDYSLETLSLTRKVLIQNPEFYTIWNNRRLIISHLISRKKLTQDKEPSDNGGVTVQQTPSEILQNELEFLLPLLLEFPKCYWLWNHRVWVIQETRVCLGVEEGINAWEKELQLVNRMLGRDNRNFHGWNYRRLITKNLEQLAEEQRSGLKNRFAKSKQQRELIENEFLYTKKMINTNLSNFSAWHQRSRLIPILLDERQASQSMRAKMLEDEFELLESALYTDPYDQSLWFYYQFLMTVVTQEQTTKSPSFLALTKEDRLRYMRRELGKLEDLLEGAEDCKWIYQALLYYASIYHSLLGDNEESMRLQSNDWLSQLKKLDPLRSNRWNDLAMSLNTDTDHKV